MARGFAAGLADGISNGLQFANQYNYYSGLNEYHDRLAAAREAQAAAKSEGNGGKGVNFDEFDKTVVPIFGGGSKPGNFADKTKPVPMGSLGGLSGDQSTLIPEAAMSGNAPAAYQAGSLASTQRPAQPNPEEDLPPRQRIVKEMLFGNLANDPDKLNAINTAAVMSGVGDKVTPWLESLYRAKKTGIADMAMNLMSGNVDGAVDIANRMKTPFADRPTKVNPNDPNDYKWNIQFDGGTPQTIDLRHMIGSAIDPDKYLKALNDQLESQGKRNVSDSQVRENDSTVGLNNAKTAQVNAETKNIRNTGGLGGGSKAPRVVKTVETNQGMVAVMSDGTQNLLKGPDGKPLYGTSGQKTAAGLIGKTLNQFGDNGDIAGKVNDLTGQLRGEQIQQAPAPAGTIRKFNPKTGGFD